MVTDVEGVASGAERGLNIVSPQNCARQLVVWVVVLERGGVRFSLGMGMISRLEFGIVERKRGHADGRGCVRWVKSRLCLPRT